MSRRFLALLLAALLLLTACARQETPEREEAGFLFYYPAESPFGADGVLCTAAPDALPETPQAVVAAYLASTPPDGARAPVPDAWTLHAVSQESDTLLVSFSGSPVSALERSLSCCCLAKTLLQLDGVRRVSITDPSGEAARVFADGDIQLTDTGMLPQQETVTLYLPDEQLRYLNRETRTVEAMAASEKPRFIVEQLLSSACIPAGTRLLNISVENGICTVDLSSEFSEGLQGGFLAERMAVYALVDSLTELSEISSVDFWVAGAPVQTLHRMDLTRGVTRDESLIAPVSEEGLLDVTLYACCGSTDALLPVPTLLTQDADRSQAETVLTALLNLPEKNGIRSCIPAGTKLLSTRMEGSNCVVDLTAEFVDGCPDTASQTRAVRAVVATLCKLRGVSGVEILVEGLAPVYRDPTLASVRVPQAGWIAD